jgi:hypothetical protein
MIGTTTAHLRQCNSCGWWTRWLSDPGGRCGDCCRGWETCPTLAHRGLEYQGGDHRRVDVRAVLAAVPDLAELQAVPDGP